MKRVSTVVFTLLLACSIFAQLPTFPRFPRLPSYRQTSGLDPDSTIIDTIDAGRTYETIAAWMSAYSAEDFVARKIIVKGVIHDSLTITQSLNFPRNTTSSFYYWWLSGGKITNVGLDSSVTKGMINANRINIVISGIDIDMGDSSTVGIFLDSCRAWVYNNKIHNANGDAMYVPEGYSYIRGINCTGSCDMSEYYIWNNVIYDLKHSNNREENEAVGVNFYGAVQKRYIYNNTIYDIGHVDNTAFAAGIDFETNGVGTEFYVENNMAVDVWDYNTYPEVNCFMIGACNDVATKVFAYNLSSDTTAHDGMGGTMTTHYKINKTAAQVFTSPSTYDLTLATDSPALNYGLGLEDTYSYDYLSNVRGFGGSWDLGAYECMASCVSATPFLVYNVGKYNVGVYGK